MIVLAETFAPRLKLKNRNSGSREAIMDLIDLAGGGS